MTLAHLLLAALLAAQEPARAPATGDVVDPQGKPIAAARVVLYAPPVGYGDGEPIEVSTMTDSRGAFSLTVPPLRRIAVNGVNFLVYSPGNALAARWLLGGRRHFALEKPRQRAIRVVGPDGRPIAGAGWAAAFIRVQSHDRGTAAIAVRPLDGHDGRRRRCCARLSGRARQAGGRACEHPADRNAGHRAFDSAPNRSRAERDRDQAQENESGHRPDRRREWPGGRRSFGRALVAGRRNLARPEHRRATGRCRAHGRRRLL